MQQDNKETVLRVLDGVELKLPQTWFQYAVKGAPVSMHRVFDNVLVPIDEKLVAEEVEAQTGAKPINCRPSQFGADATGRITWIIAFIAPVRAFTLFNTSQISRLIDKKAVISHHDPGCQGYCNPSKCSRVHRCNHCATRIDQHEGPTNTQCTAPLRCANCHGPFAAGHDACPAMPTRKSGQVLKPTKHQLDSLRRAGDRLYRAANKATSPIPSQGAGLENPQPQAAASHVPNVTRKRKDMGAAVTAHEQASTETRTMPPRKEPKGPEKAAKTPSSASSASSQAATAASDRPRRDGAIPDYTFPLTAEQAEAFGEGMDLDSSDIEC